MHARCSRMNDTFWNALVIEMRDFVAKDEILQERRAAGIGAERVLIIGERNALVGGERRMAAARDLVQFTACSRL
jgi:hypothetical protein